MTSKYTNEMINYYAEMIIAILGERKGFDSWWYSIDDETQEDILMEIESEIEGWVDDKDDLKE